MRERKSSSLGATARYVDFDELQSFYDAVDPEASAQWADRWSQRADATARGNVCGAQSSDS